MAQGDLAIFDADDTLWSTEALYETALAEMARTLGERGEDFVRLQRAIDLESVARLGFDPSRFPGSSVRAYTEIAGHELDLDELDMIFGIARRVFETPAQLLPGARSSLELLKSHDVPLVLLTKGDPEVQRARVAQSGLGDMFDEVLIVPTKTANIFRGIIRAFRVCPGNAWSIGNSIRSDLVPALEVGARVVWIDAPVWAHEHSDGSELLPYADRALTASTLLDAAQAVLSGQTTPARV